MRAWAIAKYGDNSVVKLMTLPPPEIGDNEVLIQIKAASINPVDFKIRDGKLRFILSYKLPLILGNDCSGTIVKTGLKVSKFKIGDAVYTRPHKERIGTLAEFIAVHEDAIAHKPKNLSFEEAASLPLVGLTSWQALLTRANLKKGDRVFIPAGSGGVGTFAIQLAKHFGAYVITNTSSKNLEFVKSLGADEVIDYTVEDFSKQIKDIDIVFDTMGGETQRKAFSVLRDGGTLISIVGPPTAEFAKEVGANKAVQILAHLASFTVRWRARSKNAKYKFLFMLPDGNGLEEIRTLVEAQVIRPIVDRVFPFDKANEALAYVETGRARGKVVVSV